ncbi:MAG: tRNA-dihydrouridine synthase family protein [Lachnospiraceae bacterium]|nr:tRNA-dihydrouridine synthase family protein [Lachnospiraceae bacterium]
MALIDCAPMEGLTVYSFRRNHSSLYNGVDRYFTPFLTANQNLHFQKKEIREILPENNEGICLIPQVMTNKADQMLWAMEEIASYGYREINLNLGCPYPTVVTRHKGAGFLEDGWVMDAFFDAVFEGLERINANRPTDPLKLSVKTRIGIRDPEEMDGILEIYNRYPICELIIHPRLQKQMYQGTPYMDVFARAAAAAKMPVSYNGDIRTAEDARKLLEQFPDLHAIMIGRGLMSDPALGERICGQEVPAAGSLEDLERLREYMERQYFGYKEYVMRDKEVISHIKELWFHVGRRFPEKEREVSKICRAKTREDYVQAVARFFG